MGINLTELTPEEQAKQDADYADEGAHRQKQYAAEQFRNFQFFLGVVEDRNDPLKLGRVRVRCFGIHSEDKDEVPTERLPYAMPIMPCTSASTSGIGESPTGMVEGSWVFGFFIDGTDMQQPMILGTLIGAPLDLPDISKGFFDPNGVYPKIEVKKETAVNRLARGSDINHSTIEDSIRSGENNLVYKKEQRMTDVPIAGAPGTESAPGKGDGEASTVWDKEKWLPPDYLDRKTWNEPNPRYGGQEEGVKAEYNIHDVRNNEATPTHGNETKYPLNHVNVSESGHVREIDDTSKAERIHEYHAAGTFYEIQPNGTRVTKVVGDDYLMVMHDHNMHVSGNVNITIDGHDVRLLVKRKEGTSAGPGATGGNMYIETDGDLKFNVRGNMHTKVGGTVFEEYITDQATNVNKKQSLRVGADRVTLIKGDHREDISGDHDKTITGTESVNINTDSWKYITQQGAIIATDNFTLASGNNVNIRTVSNTNINTESNFNVDATAKIDMDATGNVEITTPAIVDIDGGPEVDIDADKISLN